MDMSENERLVWAAYVAAGLVEGLCLDDVVANASLVIDDLRHKVKMDSHCAENPNADTRDAYKRLYQMVRT